MAVSRKAPINRTVILLAGLLGRKFCILFEFGTLEVVSGREWPHQYIRNLIF